jgi:tetratricopeptide (TPR) repeat protein
MSGGHEELKRGLALHRQGDLAGARRVLEASYRKNPRHPGVCQLLGVVHCQAGDLEHGVDLLRRALVLDGRNSATRLNLGKALVALERFDEALSVCAGGTGAELAHLQGDIQKMLRRLDQAAASYERAVVLRPEFFEAWNNLGNTRRDRGDLDGAIAALSRAARLRPEMSIAHLNLGRALSDARRLEEAASALREAARLAPADAVAQFELGATLAAMGNFGASLEPLRQASRLKADARALTHLGISLSALGRQREAEIAYSRAVSLRPKDPLAYLFFGIFLEESNRPRDIAILIEAAEAAGIARSELAILDAMILKREDKLGEALRVLQSSSPGENTSVAALHARLIGEVHDRLGDTEKSFDAFQLMNRLRASEQGAGQIDKMRYRNRIQRQIDLMMANCVAGWFPARVDTSRSSPSFLIGFPRSGTTLLDTILSGHPDISVLEEAPLIDRLAADSGGPENLGQLDTRRLDALRTNYFTMLDKVSGAAATSHVIDKSPLHLTSAALVHRVFPDAKFIFALRHPCDVVLSNFMQNFWVNEFGANCLDLEDAAIIYDRVMTYWTKCCNLLPLEVHTVRYESVIGDLEGQVRQLLAFLGLPWNSSVLDYQVTALARGRIGTPSYAQVTEKIYARATMRWQRYRTQMERVLPILEPWVQRFGYALREGA